MTAAVCLAFTVGPAALPRILFCSTPSVGALAVELFMHFPYLFWTAGPCRCFDSGLQQLEALRSCQLESLPCPQRRMLDSPPGTPFGSPFPPKLPLPPARLQLCGRQASSVQFLKLLFFAKV